MSTIGEPGLQSLNWFNADADMLAQAQRHAPARIKTDGQAAAKPNAPYIENSLNRLQAACEQRVQLTGQAISYTKIASQIADLLASTGLVETPLPRGNRIYCNDILREGKWYLVKCDASSTPRFVATGQDNLFTRLTLGVSTLSAQHLREFAHDLQAGLLEELLAVIEGAPLHSEPSTLPLLTVPLQVTSNTREKTAPEYSAVGTGELGRRKRRVNSA